MTGNATEPPPSPRKLLWTTALAIFAAEAMIMTSFSLLPPLPTLLEGALDALGLTVVILPILHRIWVRSLGRALDDQSRARTALEVRAHRDGLTQLPNRLAFDTMTQAEIGASQRTKSAFTLVLLDLGRFHEINDTLGQRHADALLVGVAERLRTTLPHGDRVCRIGPDIFSVLLPGIGADRALDASNRVHQVIEQAFEVANGSLEVDGHCGVAVFPDHGEDASTLLRHAESALRSAKHHGEHSRVFETSSQDDSLAPRRLKLFGLMRQALQRGELRLNYQPKVDTKTGALVGAEALITWRQPELGLISPAEFIPIAEQTNLMRPITTWVVEEAARQIAAWRAGGFSVQVAVNLSARNLADDDLPGIIDGALRRHQVPAELLVAEITESAVMADPGHAGAILEKLLARGVKLSLDDFGTGYSSLTYLRTLPAGELKIDRTFISDIDVRPANRRIVKGIVDLAHDLRLKVVGEGVETEAVLKCLREVGCDMVQGHWISRPLPAADFERFARKLDEAGRGEVAQIAPVAAPNEISLPPLQPGIRLRESLQSLKAVRPPATRSDAPL